MSIPASAQPVILHETDTWLVVSKPGGWHSVRAGPQSHDREDQAGAPAGTEPILEEWLARQRPESRALPESGLVHRLDLLTSGCVLAARTADALTRLRSMVQGRRPGMAKVYLALARGRIGDGSFDLYFRSRHRRSQKISVSPRGGESERGRCRWRAVRSQHDHTLLEVEIIGPGRRHQIRAGLAHLGHPLRGDLLYGGDAWDGGFGLHAWRLALEGAVIEAPIPGPWAAG